MKKKVLAVLMVCVMAASMTACGGDKGTSGNKQDDATNQGTDGSSADAGDNDSELSDDVQLVYDLPEGFAMNSEDTNNTDTTQMYYAPTYPTDSSNINVTIAPLDLATLKTTQEDFCKQVEDLYKQQYESEVTVNCTEYTLGELDGYDTIKIRLDYTFMDVPIEQTIFSVQIGKGTTTVTYTQMAGAAWAEAFDASIASMRIEPK